VAQWTSTRLALRDLQREIARKRRRRLQVLAVLALLVAGVVTGYFNLPGRDGPGKEAVTATPKTEYALRTQETALLQVRGPAGDAVASALLAYDSASREAVVVLVPNRVAVDASAADSSLFGQTLRGDNGPARSRRTLSDLLGVAVDASWVLDQAAFSRLVGRVDGIKADVDIDIVSRKGGTQTVVVPKGKGRELDGPRALAVINYRPPGKDELAALPRIQLVLQAVLAKLPPGGSPVGDLAGALGDGSELSDTVKAPRILDGVRAQQGADRATFSTVPVLAETAGGQATYRVEPVATTRLVSQLLATAARVGRPAAGNRVLAIDGVGRPGFGPNVRDRIVPAGFVLVDTQLEKPQGRTRTTIIIFDTTSQSTIRASQLASALGLPKAPVQVSVRTQNIADLIVRVGSDFEP